jgi:hypothetical protein
MSVSPLPQAVDQDYAELAAAVYDNNKQQVGRWMRVFDPVLAILPAGLGITARPDETSGFKAALYSDGERYVLAFTGSERETRDWLTNLGQAVGLDTAQYGQAACFAKECKVGFGDKITMTGHSLGGGLAALASAVTGCEAVTFNPAGVHDKTFRRAGIDPDKFRDAAEQGLIRKYVVRGEILDRLQNVLPAPAAPGHRIELDAPGKNMFAKHRIGVAIEGIETLLNGKSVTIAENLIGHKATAKQLANTFRSKGAKEGVTEHPALLNAYRVLGFVEARAATMGHEAGNTFRQFAREHIAGRIEHGEKIPPIRVKERGSDKAAKLAAAARSSSPER